MKTSAFCFLALCLPWALVPALGCSSGSSGSAGSPASPAPVASARLSGAYLAAPASDSLEAIVFGDDGRYVLHRCEAATCREEGTYVYDPAAGRVTLTSSAGVATSMSLQVTSTSQVPQTGALAGQSRLDDLVTLDGGPLASSDAGLFGGGSTILTILAALLDGTPISLLTNPDDGTAAPFCAAASAESDCAAQNGVPAAPFSLDDAVDDSTAPTPAGGACTCAATGADSSGDDADAGIEVCTMKHERLHAACIGPAAANTRGVVVLEYHDVVADGTPTGTDVGLAAFRRQLDIITAAGYTVVTANQVYEYVTGAANLPVTSVMLSFDDGYEGNVDAYHELESRGMAGSFFIITSTVGTKPSTKLHMDWSTLTNIEQTGHSHVYSHTRTHPQPFISLPGIDYQAEIGTSRDELAHGVGYGSGSSVKFFAYPGGGNTENIRGIVSGFYLGAFGGHDRRATPADSRYDISRFDIDLTWTDAHFASLFQLR